MKQLVQTLKDGWMGVIDVPPPLVDRGQVQVLSHFSVISAGTEGGTVSTARKSLLGKAQERPEQVRQVLEALRQVGPVQTYRSVMKKLGSYSPLGYSVAGEVVGLGQDVHHLAVGDLVACAGAGYANHAELVSIPVNLCVKLPAASNLADAAYNTLGAIAMQGIRQADVKIGETCVVIGLGLLGHLSALLLRAGGVNVIGLDINPWAINLADRHCADHAFAMDAPGLVQSIEEITQGIGADAVIITAATRSLEPINMAGRLLRKRGVVVVVGAVPTGFEREPDFYKKELSVKMSCSYGPGRYDPEYEEKGLDYPVGYVRWTENRNMAAFQDLVQSGRIDLSYLTTHRFKLDHAPAAYDLITERREDVLGILIEYDAVNSAQTKRIDIAGSLSASSRPARGTLGISFLGAGSYALGHLLPNIPKRPDLALVGVLTSSGASSRSTADKYGFKFCTAEADDILAGPETTTVFIATRHDSHADLVIRALQHGKQVFVEKPLCLRPEELEVIRSTFGQSAEENGSSLLMVGFNRRFAPLAEKLKRGLGRGPKSILYRVNAGSIPRDSWIQDPAVGGGRIIGEVCHFLDFLTFLTGAVPVSVYAAAMADARSIQDTLSVTVSYSDGSIGTIAYFANGSKRVAKEHVEVFCAGSTAILNDFKELTLYTGGKANRARLINQDKGQAAMVKNFLLAASGEASSPICFAEIYDTTRATFAILESLRVGSVIPIGNIDLTKPLVMSA